MQAPAAAILGTPTPALHRADGANGSSPRATCPTGPARRGWPCRAASSGPARLTVSLVTAGPRAKAEAAFARRCCLSAACSRPKSASHFSGTCGMPAGGLAEASRRSACGGGPAGAAPRSARQDASGRRPSVSEDGEHDTGRPICGDFFFCYPRRRERRETGGF